MSRLIGLLSAGAAAIVLLALPGGAAAASTWYVDGTLGNDANSCTAPGLSACRTIQAAINKASSGDTVVVAAGAYPESAPGPLTVNKPLTLQGAQVGVDARNPRGAESVVSDPQGTSVGASNVVIDGFTFQGSVNNAFTGFGIWLNPGISGTQILNNVVQNNIVGIGLANIGTQALIEHNRIAANNQPGAASGTGIYTDEFVGGSKVKNVLVLENAFVGNDDAAIDVSNTAVSGGVFNLDVSTNSFVSNGRAVLLFNTHDSTIQGNTVPNSTLAASAAIRLFDNNSNLAILGNDLQTGDGHAIRLSFLGAVGGPSSGVAIHQNNVGVLFSGSFTGDGLLVDPGSHVGTVDAECNWWGSSTGPTNPGNPGGLGEEVVGNADFTPWLVAPAPGGACAGTGGSTPGKVTGGGQIIGDPLFSSIGDLLTVPALIPSVGAVGGKATFGFVARCCPASGNLSYDDHAQGVRIKAQSVTALFISSPGVACPATPGSQHARFTGMASVIRSTGTTNESYTVDVDDCGEPGTSDTFGIKTASYSNGPSVLIGGNIQIHKQ